jgi:hypothetical protein
MINLKVFLIRLVMICESFFKMSTYQIIFPIREDNIEDFVLDKKQVKLL